MNKEAGLYIHIPFCTQKCSYCDFFSVGAGRFNEILIGKNGSIFAKRLINDLDFVKEKYGIKEFKSVYVGGGTPSLLSPEDFYFIFSNILKRQKEPPSEFTVEINPEDLTMEHLKAAFLSGVNRISLGIQSFSDEVLQGVKRRGSKETTLFALDLIKKFNKTSLSCDLIAGLKNQTYEILSNDLKTLLKFAPEHISLYSLCTDKTLPLEEEDNIANLWKYGKEFLENNAYIRYEVSNFSYKNSYKSIHNEKYWKLQNYLGIGPGAFGSVFFDYSSQNPAYAIRFSACKNINKWLYEKERSSVYDYEKINRTECMEEFIMMGLRLIEGMEFKNFFTRFGLDIRDVIGNTIEKWKASGNLVLTDSGIKLTEEGLNFLNKFLLDAFEEINKRFL
ncbi:radical SAM family heme chaperone HemW [Treponema pedis]|uniref:Heme chaperone HemW n=2 Tax=Treponema pedis TaxID=409322 RepID=S5ZNX9_9SPIR|nr:radical SAM family heme chaperone HemW [Treponema pedis]AGT44332.1 oxygen-independent coproporphyrinogen III oxidase [Treponema pedis str. T A4]